MKKLLKIVLLILLIAFIAIQFIKPAKNAGEEIPGNQISSIQPVPQEIEHILKLLAMIVTAIQLAIHGIIIFSLLAGCFITIL